MEEFLSHVSSTLTNVGFDLLRAVLVVAIGLKLSKWASKNVFKLPIFDKLDVSIAHFLASAIKIVLYGLTFISAAIILGVPATTFITILGSAGLAIGLALQGTLTNLAGSIMIIVFKPFKIGDFVEIGTLKGRVVDINLFYTVISTMDNKVITCPNGTLTNGNIINYTARDTRRIDLTFSVAYGSDIEKVRSILLDCANADREVLTEPDPVARLAANNESSMDFSLRAWCRTAVYDETYHRLLANVTKALRDEGIEIPFRQLDIHLRK